MQNTIPRLAMINDMAGFGRCSTTVSLPVISAMQAQVCPVPTSILSNHLGFPLCHRNDCTDHMREYIGVWKKLGLTFDGLYCGFLGSVEQAAIVAEFVEAFHPPVFLLDPVLGDHGRTYSSVTEEHCESLKKLAGQAHILTPNITEACLLTDTPYQERWEEPQLEGICLRLQKLCPGRIVITGLQTDDCFLNYIWQNGKKATYASPRTGESRPGTGDLFASILIADALYGREFCASVKKAADFVALCIQGSEEARIPVQEGVIFERYLSRLILESD